MSSLSYFHALEDLERQRAALAADARIVAAFIVGWWPGLEDGIDWSKEHSDESSPAPVLLAARRVLEATKEAPRPDAYDGAIALLDAMRDNTNHEETTMHENDAAEVTLYDAINGVRRSIKGTAHHVKGLTSVAKDKERQRHTTEDQGETIANLMLAYRHLEDASMRLGKALQAIDGGVSVYDRETTVGA